MSFEEQLENSVRKINANKLAFNKGSGIKSFILDEMPDKSKPITCELTFFECEQFNSSTGFRVNLFRFFFESDDMEGKSNLYCAWRNY